MNEPVQLKYETKDGAERIVLLPTIDITAPDMLSVIAGVVVAQHDTIQKLLRRVEALETATYADAGFEASEEQEPEPPCDGLVPGEFIESLDDDDAPKVQD